MRVSRSVLTTYIDLKSFCKAVDLIFDVTKLAGSRAISGKL